MIAVNAALFHAGDDAVLAVHHRAQVIVVADARKDEVGALRGLGRRFGEIAAVFLGPFLGFRRGAIVDGDVVAVFLQVPGHRIAHDAETDKCCLCHR